MKCPECGRFLADVEADVNGLDEIIQVTGRCAKHGQVHPNDWWYEDFYPPAKPPKTPAPKGRDE